VERICASLEALIARVRADYPALYPSGFHGAKRGTEGRRGGAQDVSDAMIGTRGYVRGRLSQIGRDLASAEGLLKGAVGNLGRIETALDPSSSTELGQAFTHPADARDLAEARQAQSRRAQRVRDGRFGAREESFG
jgi:hypothetical protein